MGESVNSGSLTFLVKAESSSSEVEEGVSIRASRTTSVFNQHHYTVEDVATMLNMSRDSVTRLFREEDGVVKITRPGNRYKRTYTTIRIPESVLNRVYARMTG
jgi:AraC-like DNA-binding protein